MDFADLFLFKLVLSFIVGGLYVAITIRISEKLGSKLGGMLIGLPSTVLISLIFIAWTQDVTAAVSATPIIPVASAISSVFVASFILLYRYGRGVALILSILLWFALATPFILLGINNIAFS